MNSVELVEAARPRPVPPLPWSNDGRRAALEVVEDPAAVEALWRSFEDEAVCSPYQRFDWVQSYAAALAARDGFRVRVLVLRDDGGRLLMLLPLAVRRQHGLTVASFVGGKQANFNLPIAATGLSSTLDANELRTLLLQAGRDLGADAFIFLNQPLSWRGEPNPLAAFGGRPSANKGYKFSLERNPDETLTRIFSKDTRGKMRRKQRRLSELGEMKFWEPRNRDEVAAVLDVFFRQKEARFRDMGIANPFEGDIQTFIRLACVAGLDRGHPAIELYALSIADRIVATWAGTGDRLHFSAMFNSFDTNPDVSRYSPGELLLAEVIRIQCERARTVFDFGLGEAGYKNAICDEVEELVDVFLPVTRSGKMYAAAAEHVVAFKRYVKQTPWAWRAARGLRAVKAAV